MGAAVDEYLNSLDEEASNSSSPSALSVLRSATNASCVSVSSTVAGPGADSGRILKALGELVNRKSEDFAILLRLVSISLRLKARRKALSAKAWTDVLEFSMRGLYNDSIRRKALLLILRYTHMYSAHVERNLERIAKQLMEWPEIDVLIFTIDLAACIPDQRLIPFFPKRSSRHHVSHLVYKDYELDPDAPQSGVLLSFLQFIAKLISSDGSETAAKAVEYILKWILNFQIEHQLSCFPDYRDLLSPSQAIIEAFARHLEVGPIVMSHPVVFFLSPESSPTENVLGLSEEEILTARSRTPSLLVSVLLVAGVQLGVGRWRKLVRCFVFREYGVVYEGPGKDGINFNGLSSTRLGKLTLADLISFFIEPMPSAPKGERPVATTDSVDVVALVNILALGGGMTWRTFCDLLAKRSCDDVMIMFARIAALTAPEVLGKNMAFYTGLSVWEKIPAKHISKTTRTFMKFCASISDLERTENTRMAESFNGVDISPVILFILADKTTHVNKKRRGGTYLVLPDDLQSLVPWSFDASSVRTQITFLQRNIHHEKWINTAFRLAFIAAQSLSLFYRLKDDSSRRASGMAILRECILTWLSHKKWIRLACLPDNRLLFCFQLLSVVFHLQLFAQGQHCECRTCSPKLKPAASRQHGIVHLLGCLLDQLPVEEDTIPS